jgi:hypothetical protein
VCEVEHAPDAENQRHPDGRDGVFDTGEEPADEDLEGGFHKHTLDADPYLLGAMLT